MLMQVPRFAVYTASKWHINKFSPSPIIEIHRVRKKLLPTKNLYNKWCFSPGYILATENIFQNFFSVFRVSNLKSRRKVIFFSTHSTATTSV